MCGTSRSRKRQLLPQTSPFLLGQQIASLQKCYIFLHRPHQLLALCFLIQHIHSTLETLCLLSIQSLRVLRGHWPLRIDRGRRHVALWVAKCIGLVDQFVFTRHYHLPYISPRECTLSPLYHLCMCGFSLAFTSRFDTHRANLCRYRPKWVDREG